MIACWCFSGIAVLAALAATLIPDLRRSILFLWVAGLAVGGIYLTLGAELLAATQWVVSTLIAMAFIFFSLMFGESEDSRKGKKMATKDFLATALSLLVGAGFAAVVALGARDLPLPMTPPAEGADIASLGASISHENLLALEVLALLLFLVLVGGGVISRPERTEKKAGPK